MNKKRKTKITRNYHKKTKCVFVCEKQLWQSIQGMEQILAWTATRYGFGGPQHYLDQVADFSRPLKQFVHQVYPAKTSMIGGA